MRYIHLRPFRDKTSGKSVTGVFVFEAETEMEYDAVIAVIDAYCDEDGEVSKEAQS